MVTINLSFLLILLYFAMDRLNIHKPAASPFWSAAKALSIATERSWQYNSVPGKHKAAGAYLS